MEIECDLAPVEIECDLEPMEIECDLEPMEIECDLAPMNIGLHWDLKKAQNRTDWRRLVATATFWRGVCQ